MSGAKNLITQILRHKKVRYLCAGGWNTLFGYGLMVVLYECLNAHFHLVAIAVLSSFISISMSFLTYKVFVFRTQGSWINEWVRSFVVYGVASLFSILLLWLFVDLLGFNIYFSQAVSMILVVSASYLGHARFTFNKDEQ